MGFLFDDEPSALKDFPVDGTPEEKFNALYAVFGTPNGLYWKNSPTGTQYTSFDEFRDAEYNKETGAKSFYLVWNYEDCTVVASCSDQFDSADVKGTAIIDIYEFPVLQAPSTSMKPAQILSGDILATVMRLSV